MEILEIARQLTSVYVAHVHPVHIKMKMEKQHANHVHPMITALLDQMSVPILPLLVQKEPMQIVLVVLIVESENITILTAVPLNPNAKQIAMRDLTLLPIIVHVWCVVLDSTKIKMTNTVAKVALLGTTKMATVQHRVKVADRDNTKSM